MDDEYDFFDTPINPYTILVEEQELNINIRHTDTMEQKSVKAYVAKSPDKLPEGNYSRLHVYGRLGERISSDWYIHILEELDEGALSTDHELAQSMDMEQALGSAEKFKESRYRKPKES
jgi:hypothetical protein